MTRREIIGGIRRLKYSAKLKDVAERRKLIQMLNEMDSDQPKEDNYDADPIAVVNSALNGWQD
jgi:hypothetical protein